MFLADAPVRNRPSVVPSPVKERRYGRFYLSHRIIESPEIGSLMAGMVVIRAESRYHMRDIEYVGAHPAFDVIEEAEAAPEYAAKVTINDDGTFTVKWDRC